MFSFENPTFISKYNMPIPGFIDLMHPIRSINPDKVYLTFVIDEHEVVTATVGLYITAPIKLNNLARHAGSSSLPPSRTYQTHPDLETQVQGFTVLPEQESGIYRERTFEFSRYGIEEKRYEGGLLSCSLHEFFKDRGIHLTTDQAQLLDAALEGALAWVDNQR